MSCVQVGVDLGIKVLPCVRFNSPPWIFLVAAAHRDEAHNLCGERTDAVPWGQWELVVGWATGRESRIDAVWVQRAPWGDPPKIVICFRHQGEPGNSEKRVISEYHWVMNLISSDSTETWCYSWITFHLIIVMRHNTVCPICHAPQHFPHPVSYVIILSLQMQSIKCCCPLVVDCRNCWLGNNWSPF